MHVVPRKLQDHEEMFTISINNNNYNNIECSSVDFLEILAVHVQYGFMQANGGSTNISKVYALLLASKHY